MPTSSIEQPAAVQEGAHPEGGKAAAPAHTHSDGSHEEHPMPMIRMIPARHTKVVHFIRHGEGFHNVAGHADPEEYKSFEYLDAHLTDFGWRQARALGKHIRALGPAFRADAVIVSPLTRTLETAAGVFGAGPWQSGDPQPPFMLEQTAVPGKRSAQQAISAAGCPPFIAWEGCREHLGQHPCDKRRPTRELAPAFPAVDFSLIESDEDVLWQLEHRETHDEIRRRGVLFVQWLMGRSERELAVVGHSSMLFFMCSAFGHAAAPTVQGELHKWYENCEMRTVVLADEGAPHCTFPPSPVQSPSAMARSRVSTCLLLLVGLLVASFGQAAQDGHRVARTRRLMQATGGKQVADIQLPQGVQKALDGVRGQGDQGQGGQDQGGQGVKEVAGSPVSGGTDGTRGGRQSNDGQSGDGQDTMFTLPTGQRVDLSNPTQAKGALLSSLRSGDSSSFGLGAAQMLRKGNRQQAQQVLTQSFAEALSGAGTGGNAQQAGRTAAVAAATAFAQSGGDNTVAIAFSQAIVTNGNTVAAAFSLAVAISIGDFNFSLAISNAIVAGGCTPATSNLLATAQATAIAQGNGGKFQAVAQASAVASCLPVVGRRL
ncbi:phosphoglycerate mutase 1 isoform X2 [Chlorella sorokiniana]|uniref:Phosphoglycerate mutase 1 isoform X2 n=1 Tax=Chlorella sorokiniana TaxID=3076 RepID=A0A2P6TM37_CHLSO|nr:phosphoglycerate mutase 1 isoform X2 [Chlorella sorokiniana]|eukprot:PRW45389.1 phosphoglycerate mutase 1 isoform X2 [Chlorella sorokiniana]